MRTLRKVLVWVVLIVVFLPLPAIPQDAPKTFKTEEIDQLVAPIALHPDALVAQILMASTYPLEVVQAARFVKENPSLKGDQLDEALKQQSWDDSVKSLVFFPQVLTMLNEKLDWLQKLGDAFLAQQQDVLASIQRLRARAQSAGQLKSTPEQQVIVEPAVAAAPPPPAAAPPAAPPQTNVVVQTPPPQTNVQVVQSPPTVIRIEPTNPEVVYVPSYNPTAVYGEWPPAYPPYSPYPAGYFAAGMFTFAAGAAVGAALWGNCNWGGGDVNINSNRSDNFTRNVNNANVANARIEHRAQGGGGQGRNQWQHNPEHRKGVQYRDNATQQRFNKGGPGNAQSREAFRGRTGSDAGRGQQGGIGQAGARGDRQGGLGQQGGRGEGGVGQQGGHGEGGLGQQGARGQSGIGQQGGGGLGDRGAQASPRAGGVGQGGAGQGRQQGGAFQGVGSGRDSQSFSNRGNTSRDSFNRSTGGGGARGGAGGGGRGGGGGGRGGGRR